MFARDTINTFLVKLCSYVLIFVATVLISNMGQRVKGEIAILFLVADLIRMITYMGIEVAIVYFLRKGIFDYDTISRNLNAALPLLHIVWTVVLLPTTYWLHSIGAFGEIRFVFIAACFVIAPLIGLYNLQLSIFNGSGEIRRGNKVSLVMVAAYLVFLTLAILIGYGETWGVIAAYCLALLAAFALGVAMNWSRGSGTRGFELRADVIGGLAAWGIKSQLGALLRRASNRVGLFLTNLFVSLFAAGVYSVAINWSELLTFVPLTLYYVLFPHASGRERSQSIDLINRVSRLSIAVMVFTVIAVGAGFPLAEKFIYSPDYSEALLPLLILLPGAAAVGVFNILMGGADALGRPIFGTYASIVSLISTVILNIILIPRFGIIGAAISTSMTGIIMLGVIAVSYHRLSGSRWSAILLPRREDLAHAFESLKIALGRDRE